MLYDDVQQANVRCTMFHSDSAIARRDVSKACEYKAKNVVYEENDNVAVTRSQKSPAVPSWIMRDKTTRKILKCLGNHASLP